MDTSQDESHTILSVEEELLFLREENARLRRQLQDSRSHIQDLTRVCSAVIDGDLIDRITVESENEHLLECKKTFNAMLDLLAGFTQELVQSVESVTSDDGCSGTLEAALPSWSSRGIWRDVSVSVNQLASVHISVIRSVAEVTKSVARGDLSRTIDLDLRGEALEMKCTMNEMVRSLRDVVYDLVETSAGDVGCRGPLGSQLVSPQGDGVWATLYENVHKMSSTTTLFVRVIAIVVTAIGRGDLTQEVDIQVEGEMHSLKLSINDMVQKLSTFTQEAEQALVGEGRVDVEDLQGTWLSLAKKMNELGSRRSA